MPGPLLGRGPLLFDSCKRLPPVTDHSVLAIWLVAYWRFDCIGFLKELRHPQFFASIEFQKEWSSFVRYWNCFLSSVQRMARIDLDLNLLTLCLHKWPKKHDAQCYLMKFVWYLLHRAIFVWPWNENARKKQKQQSNGNRAIWLVYRTDANARGFWLVKRTLWLKNFMPENFLEINRHFALTSYCNTIGQSNNAFSILGFSLAGKRKSVCFDVFIHWLIK